MIITMLCECDQGCREKIEIDSDLLEKVIRSNCFVLSSHCQSGPNPEQAVVEATSEYAIYSRPVVSLGEGIVTIPERLKPRFPRRFQ